jgi:uncharacterized protein (TIGR00369 family)
MARSAEELAARLAATPVYGALGLGIVAAGDGEVCLELRCDQRHANVDGAVHGGLLAFVADTAMGLAVRTQLAPDWLNKTLDLSIEFVRGARQGDRLTVVARVDEVSRRFRWASARLDAGGALVARARSLNLVETPE